MSKNIIYSVCEDSEALFGKFDICLLKHEIIIYTAKELLKKILVNYKKVG